MNPQYLIYSFHWFVLFHSYCVFLKPLFVAGWMNLTTTAEIRCWNLAVECVNTDRVVRPQMKPGLYEPLCTLVTQLLNPVRPKWLRPSRHLNLAAPHSDRLRRHWTRHMVVVSLSPHIHMCGKLSKVVGTCTKHHGHGDAPCKLSRSVAPAISCC